MQVIENRICHDIVVGDHIKLPWWKDYWRVDQFKTCYEECSTCSCKLYGDNAGPFRKKYKIIIGIIYHYCYNGNWSIKRDENNK